MSRALVKGPADACDSMLHVTRLQLLHVWREARVQSGEELREMVSKPQLLQFL